MEVTPCPRFLRRFVLKEGLNCCNKSLRLTTGYFSQVTAPIPEFHFHKIVGLTLARQMAGNNNDAWQQTHTTVGYLWEVTP